MPNHPGLERAERVVDEADEAKGKKTIGGLDVRRGRVPGEISSVESFRSTFQGE